jgi:putative peptidoglycan lipid II flippase
VGRGLDLYTQDLAVSMMRIIAINPFLFAVSSVFTSVQQAIGRFFFFAVAPITYNLGIIFCILVLSDKYGIKGVAYGVAIGSVIQLIVSMFGLVGLGYEYNMKIFWNNIGFRKVLKLLPARSLDQGIDYLLVLVETSIASHLLGNAISQYQSAFKLHLAPITLIGVAISTAFFPKLSEKINMGRKDLFAKELRNSLKIIIWFALPASIIAFFGRGYLVRLLFAKGNPTVASLLGILVVAIFFRSIYHILSRSFYAQQDTKTPLYVSLVAIGLNVVLAIILGQSDAYGVRGLAIAQSIVAALEVMILLYVLKVRFEGIFTMKFFNIFLRMVASGVIMSFVIYLMIGFVLPLQIDDLGWASAVKFMTSVTVGAAAYLATSSALGIEESRGVTDRIIKFIYRPVKVES